MKDNRLRLDIFEIKDQQSKRQLWDDLFCNEPQKLEQLKEENYPQYAALFEAKFGVPPRK